MGKDVAKMLLQAVIFGIGIEVGKDIYVWFKQRGRVAAGATVRDEDGPPEDREEEAG